MRSSIVYLIEPQFTTVQNLCSPFWVNGVKELDGKWTRSVVGVKAFISFLFSCLLGGQSEQ